MDIQYFQASANLKKTLNSGYTLVELLITMAVFAIDVWAQRSLEAGLSVGTSYCQVI